MAVSQRLLDLLREISAEILEAQRPLRVIRLLEWPEEVEREFFENGARELPHPSYQVPVEVEAAGKRFRTLAQRVAGDNEIERFLRDTCVAMATAARMLHAVGSKDFYFHSVEIYGRPGSLSSDRRTSNADLARHFEGVIASYAPPPAAVDQPSIDAVEAAGELRVRFQERFPGHEVRVAIVDQLASNASASVDEIKIKRGARFSPRDLRQIEYHELGVHVTTALNGRAQPVMPFIGVPSPRTTRTQEGLAVFTEFVTRATSLTRVRRLCDRTLAVQMAEEGANFLDLYRFFLSRGHDEHASFDCARRVCRG
ncbi:MAG: tyrosine/phenylalanine carboxypeptidase domain-containing protein, partial [Polyangia bacterium]